jgi:Zn-dependent peptidase ImmA (M78 family)/predicted secreted protein
MSTFRERREARLRGSGEAIRAWIRLGLDPDTTVDVFRIIEQARVWLLFEPLQDLFGFFQREAEVAGMVLHSGHPLSVQRFTAAHEYGHFLLGHELSADSIEELFGGADVPIQELEAQAFAAEFLMPLPLVNRALDRLSLPREPHNLTPVDAYQLSLEMGSSYTATVTQLSQLNKLPTAQLEELKRSKPIDIKIELGRGQPPANSRSDVWLIDQGWRERKLQLRLEDELHIRLPEIPTSGYRWAVAMNGMGESLELLADELEPADLVTATRFGNTRRRHLWWRAVAPARGTLDVRLVRSWLGSSARPADALSLPISVDIPRTGLDTAVGISLPQRRAMLNATA